MLIPSILLLALSQTAADAGVDEEPDPARQTVITGSRTERKASDVVVPTEVITRAQIEQLGVRDLAQLLQQQQGVELVHTNRSVGLRLQGMDPEYVLVLIDGQRVAGRAGPAVDISRFSLRDVERVEIVKGPAAALYGAEAIGGVINLITRRPEKPLEASLRGMYGTLGEADVRGHVATRQGPFEARGGAGFRMRDAWDWEPKDAATSGPAQRRFDADLELAYAPSDDLRAWVRSNYVRTDFDAVDINDSAATFDRKQRTEAFDVWAGARGNPSERTGLTLRGHYGIFRDQFLVDQRGSRALDEYSQNLTRLYELYGQVDHRVGDHLLTAGLEGLMEVLGSSRLEPALATRGRVGALVQDEWSPSERFKVSPGLRYDFDSQFGGAFSPRLAFKADPTRAVTFRASFGVGFRPPSFQELYFQFSNAGIGYVVQGNPALSAERSRSVNVSVDYRPPIEGWVMSGSAWHTSLSNLINITSSAPPNPDNPTRFSYVNVSDAYTQGVELTARARLSRGTYLDLGYMGTDAQDVARKRPLEGRAAHRVNAQVSAKYRPRGLEGVLRVSWTSGRPYYLGEGGGGITNVLGFGASSTVWAPAYLDLEVQLTYTFREWLKLFVNGYNLLNAGDQQFNPRPPRGVLGGVMVQY